jgi:hypothetical protein
VFWLVANYTLNLLMLKYFCCRTVNVYCPWSRFTDNLGSLFLSIVKSMGLAHQINQTQNCKFEFSKLLKVNNCQKLLFLHQLTHNMTTDCSLNYQFSTWKFQAQNMLCTQIFFYIQIFLWNWSCGKPIKSKLPKFVKLSS